MRFVCGDTPRSGQRASLGADLLAFMDALSIPRAILGGYDWGARAAYRPHFKDTYERRIISETGHNLPQETPSEFAFAILSLGGFYTQ
jgi:hypothetical protein